MQQKGATLVMQLQNGCSRRVHSGEQTGKRQELCDRQALLGGGGLSV